MSDQPPFTDGATTTPADGARHDGHATCGAAKRSGGTCTQTAGWGTPHPGVGACKLHGGSTPSGVKAAAVTQAKELLGTLGIVEDPSTLPAPIVYAELELSAAKQLAAVRWLEQQVGALRPEQLELSPFTAMLRDARRDSDRLLVELARLGIDERRVRLEEHQVRAVLRVLEAFSTALGHDWTLPQVQAAARQSLLTVDGEVAA